jgi:WD40 repeat protein
MQWHDARSGGVHTGQMGKAPFVLVWDVATATLERKIGAGFFQRLVCCIGFSPDGKRLAAVSADDHHMLGVWDRASGALLVEVAAQNGPPPQIWALQWVPWGDGDEGCAEIVTVGAAHFKVWAVTDATPPQPRSRSSLPPLPTETRISGRNGLYGKAAPKHPRIMHSVAFVASERQVVTGGDNGYVYIWKRGAKRDQAYSCLASFFAHKGAVYSLLVGTGDRWLFSGGGDGYVRCSCPFPSRKL